MLLAHSNGRAQANEPLLCLHDGWWLASGCHLSADGARLSSAAYEGSTGDSWKQTAVPATVLAAQIYNGELVKTETNGRVTLRMRNDSQALAFQVALRALDGHDAPVLPAFWSDNYVSLLPGESKIFTVRPSAYDRVAIAAIRVSGWNVGDVRVPVTGGAQKRHHDQEAAALPFARASASPSQPRRSDSTGMLDR